MDRCSSCNGVVTKQDSRCYMCGERLGRRAKRAKPDQPVSAFSNMLFMASLGLTAFSFFSPYKLPLSITVCLSALFFLLSVADRYLIRKTSSRRDKFIDRLTSRQVGQ